MGEIVYYVVPSGAGWHVASRGFGWQFAQRRLALRFALHTARDFAGSTGRATAVLLQRADGSFRRLLAFAGIARLRAAVAAWPRPAGARQR
jgi:hypothetical protein